MGESIRTSLNHLAHTVGDVAYNIVFHSAPYRVGEPYHWHAHIWPKATTTAGFELGTGVAINVVSPEESAEMLKMAALTTDPLSLTPQASAQPRLRPQVSGPGRTDRASSNSATRLRTTSRSGPASPAMPGVLRYPVRTARRLRASQARPNWSTPSRPAGSRSAAAMVLAWCSDHNRSATSPSGERQVGSLVPGSTPPGPQSLTIQP